MSYPESDDFVWGVMFHGRGPFINWHDSRETALQDAESVEDKYAPAELVRLPLSALERSDKFFYGARISGAERRWHSRDEAVRDAAL